MLHGRPIRLISSLAVIALTLTASVPASRSNHLGERRSAAENALVEFGMDRFHAHGMTLPDLRIEFRPNTTYCDGHMGLYYHSELRLRMCSHDKKTMLHELAHAWANLNLSDEEKAAFSSFRGVRWNTQSDAWRRRGTEQAAEIIAWALADERHSLRWVQTEAGVTVSDFRLLSIENSNVEALHRGFVFLTGREPMFRSSIELSSSLLEREWQQTSGRAISPEALRAGVSLQSRSDVRGPTDECRVTQPKRDAHRPSSC